MKSYRIIVAAALALMLSACQGGKAKVDCTVKDAPSEKLAVCQLNGIVPEVLDTVKTDAAGRFTYKVKETIYNTLQNNNIEIPFPQRDVYIRQMSSPEKTKNTNKK